ncbi:hypothetical protein [Chitinophaga flava]|uniref:Uncharacterized protein n=1 Tax=Chitinophaga flava TaxID=2259036 RepID=A0A365Y6B4_9BACT|nr:hypothetical protein [Chitinophaga flava]RBL94030.1 hypothetical protein DF182_16260 [Chitinophaga flava]
MIAQLPFYIPLVFILTTIATLLLFYMAMRASTSAIVRKRSVLILIGLILWLALQGIFAITGVFTATDAMPPRILLWGVLPALITIIVLFLTTGGRAFIDSLPLTNLTYLHMVRIPVEIVLWWLFLNKTIPQLMTFEGRNFDILAGTTAPFVAYYGLQNGKQNRQAVLIWQLIALGLLLNIVFNAILSAPTPFQKFAFDQPNVAIFYFPFSWLPAFIVQVVLFAHLAAIRQLTVKARVVND